jgi:hypothetical protein
MELWVEYLRARRWDLTSLPDWAIDEADAIFEETGEAVPAWQIALGAEYFTS